MHALIRQSVQRLALAAGLLLALGLAGCAAKPGVVEQDGVMTSRGQRVPVTFVAPTIEPAAGMPLVILIHGHGGTRHEAGAFTRVAQQLALAGIASIRMDFPGSGDSSEPFYRNDLTNMGLDIQAARRFAMTNALIDSQRIGLLGFSMGGRLAALESQRTFYPAMVMWAPAVVNGADDVVAMLGGEQPYRIAKAHAERDGWVPFTTFWGQQQQLGERWFADMEASRPMDAIGSYRGRLLLIHGSADEVVPPEVSARAAAAATEAASVERIVIEGADHGFGLFAEVDLYSDQLVRESVEFLIEALQ